MVCSGAPAMCYPNPRRILIIRLCLITRLIQYRAQPLRPRPIIDDQLIRRAERTDAFQLASRSCCLASGGKTGCRTRSPQGGFKNTGSPEHSVHMPQSPDATTDVFYALRRTDPDISSEQAAGLSEKSSQL